MTERILLITGSSIMLALGGLHIFYTFFSEKLFPKNAAVAEAMRNTAPRLTRETSMWKSWIGFNASHSLGAIYFGVINLGVAVGSIPLAGQSFLFQSLNILTLLLYAMLAKKYWFRIPLFSIAMSCGCFVSAFILQLIKT